MKIVVIGGSGLIGSRLVMKLRDGGHEVIAASPNTGVNTVTGEGLADALRGASVVVDVSNSPSFEDAAALKFFETSTRNLLTHEATAGVRHHVALSVVGTERLAESGYFRAKIAQEQLIKSSAIPYSIVHATQFFEFLEGIADVSMVGGKVRLPPVLFQPMAADDVASGLARIAVGPPVRGTVEIAGPEQFRLDELVQRRLAELKDSRQVIADSDAPYSGAKVSLKTLLPETTARLGETRFETWLARSLPMTEEFFEGSSGRKVFLRSWRPPSTPRGVVLIVHGLMAHSGLYEWVAESLVKSGLAVYALDLLGHGKSEGEPYFTDTVDRYVEDVAKVVEIAKTRDPGLPVFVLGHSAGGVVSCTYALDHQKDIAGLVCESFAYEVPAPDLALALLKGLSHIAPHLHVFRLKDEDFSRDPKFVDKMKADPLVHHMAYPTSTVAALVRTDERLKKELQKITIPVLIVHGTADKVTKPSGSKHFYEKAGSTDKTLKLYEGHYHDLLNDVGRDAVMADITEWITRHSGVPASAHG
jgi:acylglycerol lipase